jgi:hypothetical protein
MLLIGKCLAFYFKYSKELDYLLRSTEKPVLDGLPDPDQVIEVASEVNEKARREARKLLARCDELIAAQLEKIVFVSSKAVKDFVIKYGLESKTHKGLRTIELGLLLETEQKEIILYLWCPGGKAGAAEIARILGSRRICRDDWEKHSGTTAILRKKVFQGNEDTTEVQWESIIREVSQVVNLLTQDEIDAIVKSQARK